jgi:hypothetical protein
MVSAQFVSLSGKRETCRTMGGVGDEKSLSGHGSVS